MLCVVFMLFLVWVRGYRREVLRVRIFCVRIVFWGFFFLMGFWRNVSMGISVVNGW